MTVYSEQQIINAVRVDADGNPISEIESLQQALNAVFDEDNNALRIRTVTE